MPSNQSNQTDLAAHHSPKTLHLLLGLVIALVILIGAMAYKLIATKKASSPIEATTKKATTVTVPPDAVRISGCIPGEGEHWVQPDKLPHGPLYVTYNDKVIAVEYMFTDTDIPGRDFAHMGPAEADTYLKENNLSLSGLLTKLDYIFPFPDAAAVKNWSIFWTPPHAGYVIPHYDAHFYLVDEEERKQVCPNATFEGALPAELMQQLKKQNIPYPQAP